MHIIVILKERRRLIVHVGDPVFSINLYCSLSNKPSIFIFCIWVIRSIWNYMTIVVLLSGVTTSLASLLQSVCFKKLHCRAACSFWLRPYCGTTVEIIMWQISNQNLDSLCVVWRKCVRRIRTIILYLTVCQCIHSRELCHRSLNCVLYMNVY